MPGVQLSPGVKITEEDQSTRISPAAVSIGVYVGRSIKGPVWSQTLVTNEREFAELFGDPTDDNYEDFFTAAGFLTYGNTLYYTRVVDAATAQNAQIDVTTTSASAGTGDYIADWEDYTPSFGGTDKFQFFAKYPGAYGNTEFKLVLINNTDWANISTVAAVSAYESDVDTGPSTTDESVILVYVKNVDGDYEYQEQWLVSDTAGTKDNFGNNIYINERINRGSKYILAFNNTSTSGEPESFGQLLPAGGVDGTENESDIVDGYALYDNPEDISINYVIGGSHTVVATQSSLITLADVTRADCIAILDVPKTDVVNIANQSTAISNVVDFRKNELNANAKRAALYANWLNIYDKYSDVYRWVPCSGYVAGIYAHSANVTDAWRAPAGLNRGILNNIVRVAINPNLAQRDTLYKNQINSIVKFPGQGTVVWGQKTLLSKPSSFDRVNVVNLFNYLESSIKVSAKYVTFEPNDDLTVAMYRNMVEPFLDDVVGRRGIVEYVLEFDRDPELIENNRFVVRHFIKPTKAAEFIQLIFISSRQDANFSEIG